MVVNLYGASYNILKLFYEYFKELKTEKLVKFKRDLNYRQLRI